MDTTLTSIRTHARRVHLGTLLTDPALTDPMSMTADRRRAPSTDHEILASVRDR